MCHQQNELEWFWIVVSLSSLARVKTDCGFHFKNSDEQPIQGIILGKKGTMEDASGCGFVGEREKRLAGCNIEAER